MNKTNIEWCDYTWNPVVGCKNNCSYCYAKKLNDRFKYIPDWNEPRFFPERFEKLNKKIPPSRIFVGSMCDLFGNWVNPEWIEQTIRICNQYSQHTFMFLTKNPRGYNGWHFPRKTMLGLTLTTGNQQAINEFVKTSGGYIKYISIEPILGSFEGISFKGIDLIFVGAMTGPKKVIPKKEWIESIQNIPKPAPVRFYKNNIRPYLSLPIINKF